MKKKEFIDYLINDCYSNFPELMEKFPKRKMRFILSENINTINYDYMKESKYGVRGCYNIFRKNINLHRNEDKKDEQLNKNVLNSLKNVVVHEGTHALFTGFDFNNLTVKSGCTQNKSVISMKHMVSKTKYQLKSKKNMLEKIIILNKAPLNLLCRYIRWESLNEGFTEWVVGNCTRVIEGYIPEVFVLNQLENFKSKKEILEIGNGRPNEIANLFNMNKSEFDEFMLNMDSRLYNEDYIKSNYAIKKLKQMKESNKEISLDFFNENEIIQLQKKGLLKNNEFILDNLDEIYNAKIGKIEKRIKENAIYVQNKLMEKIILPGIQKDIDENNLEDKKIFKVFNNMNIYLKRTGINSENIIGYNKIEKLYNNAVINCYNKFYDVKKESEKSKYCTSDKFMIKPLEKEKEKNQLEIVKKENKNQKTFLNRFINKIINVKNLTLEDIKKSPLILENNRENQKNIKGEKDIDR